MMMDHFGASWMDVARFMHNGLDAAWIDNSTRKAWKKLWQTEVEMLTKDLVVKATANPA